MATIRFGIVKNAQEWDKIKKIFHKRNEGKNRKIKGDGCSQFISSELNKILKDIPSGECVEQEIKHVKKFFHFKTTDENANKIICMSNNLGISPGAVIAKLILDPHLLENK